MNLVDTLQQAINAIGTKPEDHFDAAAQTAPADALSQSLAAMFRSDATPSFASMVGQLFGQSNATQQAGLLNQLLATAGPALLSSAVGARLATMMAPGQSQLTPEQASKLSTEEVQAMAAQAEQAQPGVVEQIGHFYAEHATLIKTLGGAALAIALAKLREHQKA